MKSTTRSVGGAALMLAIVPIIVGLLACMPVPIGDPERSRIDPELSGVWALTEDDEEGGLYLFRPYDKRTWLVVGLEEGGPASAAVYKAWLAKLGGETFMTWEQTGGFDSKGGISPEVWFVFRVEKDNSNQVKLHMLDIDYKGFEDIPKPTGYEGNYVKDMRRRFESVIKKNVDDEEMYADALRLQRLSAEDLSEASELFQEVIAFK